MQVAEEESGPEEGPPAPSGHNTDAQVEAAAAAEGAAARNHESLLNVAARQRRDAQPVRARGSPPWQQTPGCADHDAPAVD